MAHSPFRGCLHPDHPLLLLSILQPYVWQPESLGSRLAFTNAVTEDRGVSEGGQCGRKHTVDLVFAVRGSQFMSHLTARPDRHGCLEGGNCDLCLFEMLPATNDGRVGRTCKDREWTSGRWDERLPSCIKRARVFSSRSCFSSRSHHNNPAHFYFSSLLILTTTNTFNLFQVNQPPNNRQDGHVQMRQGLGCRPRLHRED